MVARRFVGVEVERDELGSLAREQLRNRGADARARAGHNGDLPLEIEHHEEDGTISQPSGEVKVTARVCVYFIAKVSRLAGGAGRPAGPFSDRVTPPTMPAAGDAHDSVHFR